MLVKSQFEKIIDLFCHIYAFSRTVLSLSAAYCYGFFFEMQPPQLDTGSFAALLTKLDHISKIKVEAIRACVFLVFPT